MSIRVRLPVCSWKSCANREWCQMKMKNCFKFIELIRNNIWSRKVIFEKGGNCEEMLINCLLIVYRIVIVYKIVYEAND